jgi:hypothetical protein
MIENKANLPQIIAVDYGLPAPGPAPHLLAIQAFSDFAKV